MKLKKSSYKPFLIIDGYALKKQAKGGFKIIEYSHMSDERILRKKTKYKDLPLSSAEDMLYRLETNVK